MIPKIGLHKDIPIAEYLTWEAVTYDVLKAVRRSPGHARARMLEMPDEDTMALVLGRALHAAILEPALYLKTYAVGPQVDKRYKEGKEKWAEFEAANVGKNIITESQSLKVDGMRTAIQHSRTATEVLLGGETELSICWKDPETGMLCKGRLDKWNKDLKTIIDLKTARDASFHAFRSKLVDFGYDQQGAFYRRGMEVLGLAVDSVVFVAVEPEEPYGVGVYELDDTQLPLLYSLNKDMLKKWAFCVGNSHYPTYEDCPQVLSLPDWYSKQLQEAYGSGI